MRHACGIEQQNKYSFSTGLNITALPRLVLRELIPSPSQQGKGLTSSKRHELDVKGILIVVFGL